MHCETKFSWLSREIVIIAPILPMSQLSESLNLKPYSCRYIHGEQRGYSLATVVKTEANWDGTHNQEWVEMDTKYLVLWADSEWEILFFF